MSKYKETERGQAIRRGLEFMYRSACDPESFEIYGHDYLFCFNCIAATSKDAGLRKMARALGRERARQWRREHEAVPQDADAHTVVQFVFGSDAADRLGVVQKSLRAQIREAAARFTARDYFNFDPQTEPPPEDAPDTCACGTDNPRGRKRCRSCRTRLELSGRYGVWIVALIRTYIGERYGVQLGAPYAEVLKWQPFMTPYRGYEGGNNPDFYWTVYAVTHVAYTLNDYGVYQLSPRWLPLEFEFLKKNLKASVETEDPEMTGEFLDTLKSFGLTDRHALIREGYDYVLSRQNPDGSWGNTDAEDTYQRYHPTFTAINGLRDYRWHGTALRFPELKPLLKQWACGKLSRV